MSKESYSDKLRDPRWQKKRLEVFNRDRFRCVICGDDKTQLQVHHLKYLPGRDPWDYPLELLETRCQPCHERGHTRRYFRFYFAGRITKHGWRSEILGIPRIQAPESGLIYESIVPGGHSYCGPYFVSCDHGCAHVDGHHGCHINDCTRDARDAAAITGGLSKHHWNGREIAFKNSIAGIRACDIVFAWIEDDKCYGTLAELGYAKGIGREIFIAYSKWVDPIWFISRMDSFSYEPQVFKTAKDGFSYLLKHLALVGHQIKPL